jgi:hypothetical protein
LNEAEPATFTLPKSLVPLDPGNDANDDGDASDMEDYDNKNDYNSEEEFVDAVEPEVDNKTTMKDDCCCCHFCWSVWNKKQIWAYRPRGKMCGMGAYILQLGCRTEQNIPSPIPMVEETL